MSENTDGRTGKAAERCWKKEGTSGKAEGRNGKAEGRNAKAEGRSWKSWAGVKRQRAGLGR